MAEETIFEKAGKAVGFGMAMAEDLAGTVETAVGLRPNKVNNRQHDFLESPTAL